MEHASVATIAVFFVCGLFMLIKICIPISEYTESLGLRDQASRTESAPSFNKGHPIIREISYMQRRNYLMSH